MWAFLLKTKGLFPAKTLAPVVYWGMSTNNWERGEIKMSVKEFGSFRRDMIAFYNGQQTQFLAKAQQVYTALKSASKGKRNFDFESAFDLAMLGMSEVTLQNSAMFYNNTVMRHGEPSEKAGYDEIKDAIFPYEQVEGKGYVRSRRPKAPKKASFAHLKQNADGMSVGHEGGISFVKKLRTVIWSVPENNHAVDRAHDHPVGREFFKRLSRVNWTRGTGGQITGNDEYNRENRGEGEGSNYVTARYGVAEKQFKQSLNSIRSYRRGF